MRPTTDRIRETLFNWLGQNTEGLRCLDVFAGTGALGFEAASRQAKTVCLIERDKKAFANLETNLKALQSSKVDCIVKIHCRDGLTFLKSQPNQSWDLVFLDPPFDDKAALESAAREAARVCSDGFAGGIYIEAPLSADLLEIEGWLADWQCVKQMMAGQVKAFLFRLRRD